MDKLLILNRIKEYKNFSSDRELADFLGITTQNLSNWKSRNTIDYDLIFTKCVDINFSWLLTGKGQMILEETTPPLDKRLQEIQELNPEDQQRIYDLIDALIRDAKASRV